MSKLNKLIAILVSGIFLIALAAPPSHAATALNCTDPTVMTAITNFENAVNTGNQTAVDAYFDPAYLSDGMNYAAKINQINTMLANSTSRTMSNIDVMCTLNADGTMKVHSIQDLSVTSGGITTTTRNNFGTNLKSVGGGWVNIGNGWNYKHWHGTESFIDASNPSMIGHSIGVWLDDSSHTISNAILSIPATGGPSAGFTLNNGGTLYHDVANNAWSDWNNSTISGIFSNWNFSTLTFPFDLTLTITDTSNAVTVKTLTFTGWNQNFVTNMAPTGNYTGAAAPTFTWSAPLTGHYAYSVRINGMGIPFTWNSNNGNGVGTTSVPYTGTVASLPSCASYSFIANDVFNNRSEVNTFLGVNLQNGAVCPPSGPVGGGTASVFAGTYSGSFSGGDTGTWTAIVDALGAIAVTGNSATVGAINGSGTVSSNGSLTMTAGGSVASAVFTGIVDLTTRTITGTWTNSAAGLNGSFSGGPSAIPAGYVGTYSGTFSGGDSGTWTDTISQSGAITLSGNSNNLAGTYTGGGQVVSWDAVQATMVGSTSTGSTFNGTINLASGAVSGTWSNNSTNMSGTLTGTRGGAQSTSTTTTTVVTTTTTTLGAATTVYTAGAIASIQAQMTTLQNLFATAKPAATDPALMALFDAGFLDNGMNKTAFLPMLTAPNDGLNVGDQFIGVTAVAPLDAGAVMNDATHQWFDFALRIAGGYVSHDHGGGAWLAIKDTATGNWLVAGNRRHVGVNVSVEAQQHIPPAGTTGATVMFSSQVNFNVDGKTTAAAGVTSVVATGPGIVPASGVMIYSSGQNNWVSPCGTQGPVGVITTDCMDASQATAGSHYTFSITAAGGPYTYTETLYTAPVPAASLTAANFPAITSVTPTTFASGSTVTINWTLPAGLKSEWLDIKGWANVAPYGQLFQAGSNLSGTALTKSLAVPAYTGTWGGANVYLQASDANGVRYATNQEYTSSVTPANPLGTHTAGGTYTWDPATSVLTWNWTNSDFVCDGPKLVAETKTGVVITATTMSWPGGNMVWTRTSGTAGAIAGIWTSTDSATGNTFTLTINADSTMSAVGNVVACPVNNGGNGNQNPFANSQHWSSGYSVQPIYDDPSHAASSVSVTGPGIVNGPAALAYDATWGNWNVPLASGGTGVFIGTTTPAGLPYVYTFTITDANGTRTATSTVSCFQQQFATNLSPAGSIASMGNPTFSWTGINDAGATYGVELHGPNGGPNIWSNYNINGTSVVYNGPALTPGVAYSYNIVVTSGTSCPSGQSFAQGSFTYGNGVADTTAPTVPSGVNAVAAGANQVNLSWTPSTDNVGVTGYMIYRNGNSNPAGQPAGATNTSWQDYSVTGGNTYTYTVTACDAANNCSAQSLGASVTTPTGAATCTAPQVLQNGVCVTPAAATFTLSLANNGGGSVTSNPSGIDCGTTCTASFNQGVMVMLTATPGTGYSFSGWSGACSGAGNTCEVTMNAALSVTASFAAASPGVSLVSGWNLIGNGNDASLDVATAFGDTAKVTTVWKWIPTTSKWAFYAPSLTSQNLASYAASKGYDVLTAINGGEGFWVNAKTAFTVQLPAGTSISASYFQDQIDPAQNKLLKSWNLIAIGETKTPSQFNIALSTTPVGPGQVPSNVTTLWAWDSTLMGWYFYASSLEAQGGTKLVDYITGKSYLDFTQYNKKLGQGVGFWVNKP